MELKTYMRISTQKELGQYKNVKKEKVFMRLFKKNGVITFSNLLTGSLKLKKFMPVTIHQDANEPDKWFLEIGGGDFSIYDINITQLGFCTSAAVRDFYDHFNLSGTSVKVLVNIIPLSFDKKLLYPLDTSEFIKK